ncbi:MAG: dTMP kinase [Boseongicola sp.]
MSKGRFITFEGIDGSGKSTQARLLHEHLSNTGHNAVLTREPGGSAGAEEIRRLLVEGDPERWSPETEILLFTAARRDHLEKTIQPALDRGAIVVSDRFADSTRVYQGAARGELRNLVDTLHDAVIDFEPFLTFVIDMDPEIALARGLARRSGEDRFEEMGPAFQQKLQSGFRTLAKDWPERCHLIDGAQSEEAVATDVATIADALI